MIFESYSFYQNTAFLLSIILLDLFSEALYPLI